ncbi:MAG: T9SS type A sorting domain-containing protein, partial [Bacteroidota bacterium]
IHLLKVLVYPLFLRKLSYNVTITGTNINYSVVSPSITFIVDNTTIPTPVLTFANNIISSSVNSTSYNYSWTFNGMPLAGATSPSVPALQGGCYAVTVQDQGGCYVTSDTLCVIPLGINEITSSNNIKVFPNPFSKSSRITFDNPKKNNFSLKIIDITGRELQSIKNIFSDNVIIEKGSINTGIYFYELTNVTKNDMYKGKIVVN